MSACGHEHVSEAPGGMSAHCRGRARSSRRVLRPAGWRARSCRSTSEARLRLIRRFAAAACMAENLEAKLANGEEVGIQHALLSSTLARLGQRIGLGRHAAKLVPNLGDCLEQRAAKTVKP